MCKPAKLVQDTLSIRLIVFIAITPCRVTISRVGWILICGKGPYELGRPVNYSLDRESFALPFGLEQSFAKNIHVGHR